MENRKGMHLWRIIGFLIGGPIIIGGLLSLIIQFSPIYIITGIYGIMLFFMLPSDTSSGRMLDYTIKTVNPTYQHTNPDFKNSGKQELIYLLVVIGAFVSGLLLAFVF